VRPLVRLKAAVVNADKQESIMPTKAERHDAIRERAREAIRDLYHNATPYFPYIDDEDEAEQAQAWFDGAAEFEIEYLRDGGAYGRDYRMTLAAECNAGRYKSEAARQRYIAKGMRDMRRERSDCGALDGWAVIEIAAGNKRRADMIAKAYGGRKPERNDARWEEICEYGQLYQWGRGGRTLAPADLYLDRGGFGGTGPNEGIPDDLTIRDCIDLIRIVESFNAYVRQWCSLENISYMWAEVGSEICDEREADRQADMDAEAAEVESSRPDMYEGASA
jgi:hypothetical protein